MSAIAIFIPNLLFIVVGVVSLSMAWKSILTPSFLPFHEKASGKQWKEIDGGVQSVIIMLLRVSGLGFLVVGLMLISFPLLAWQDPAPTIRYIPPGLSLVFCLGLALFNFQLHKKNNVATPWKRSLYAASMILVGIFVSLFN